MFLWSKNILIEKYFLKILPIITEKNYANKYRIIKHNINIINAFFIINFSKKAIN